MVLVSSVRRFASRDFSIVDILHREAGVTDVSEGVVEKAMSNGAVWAPVTRRRM